MAKKETVKKVVKEEVKPVVKKEAKKVDLIDNKIYSFEANGSGLTRLKKGKVYSVSGSSARELIKKGLGKII